MPDTERSSGSTPDILGSRVRPLIVGLTGNIGGGKSSVARLLEQRGALIVDADDLARQATNDPDVLRRISEELGPELVKDDGLDRPAMAAKVFADPEARTVLNSIIHPWVGLKRMQVQAEAMNQPDPPPVIVHDVPLLFEVGLQRSVDVTVVVTAPLAERAARVARRSGLTREQVEDRDAAQMPQEEKAANADYVIDNSGGETELEAQVARLWSQLMKRRG